MREWDCIAASKLLSIVSNSRLFIFINIINNVINKIFARIKVKQFFAKICNNEFLEKKKKEKKLWRKFMIVFSLIKQLGKCYY